MDDELDARCSHLRRGWYWGTQAFRERMLALAQVGLGRNRSRGYRSAAVKRAHSLDQAERWLRAGLEAAGLDADDFARSPGSDPRKVELARLLREHTTVSQGWLGERLQMRSAANVSQQLRRRLPGRARLPQALERFIRSVKI